MHVLYSICHYVYILAAVDSFMSCCLYGILGILYPRKPLGNMKWISKILKAEQKLFCHEAESMKSSFWKRVKRQSKNRCCNANATFGHNVMEKSSSEIWNIYAYIYPCEKRFTKAHSLKLKLALQAHLLEWCLPRFGKEVFIYVYVYWHGYIYTYGSYTYIPTMIGHINDNCRLPKIHWWWCPLKDANSMNAPHFPNQEHISRFGPIDPHYVLLHLVSNCCCIEGNTNSIQ